MTQTLQNRAVAEIFNAALKAVNPYNAVKLYADKIRDAYRDGHFQKFIVIGFGKAACNMAKAAADELGELINRGVVVTKYGHCEGREKGVKGQGSRFKVFEAGHPLPDGSGVKGTEEIVRLLKDADRNTLVLCLVSGGGSALLVSPYEGISLDEKQKITQLLLKAGAEIYELNTVRKHISKVKGGRLAEIAYPAKIVSLILSDVIGERLDVIASGPTSPDTSTFHDALAVLEKYKLKDNAPQSILDLLNKGVKGELLETPKENNPIFSNVENVIIGSNKIALEAAKQKAEDMGFQSKIISSELSGEARGIGKWLADIARSKRLNSSRRLNCLISGGETTVTVKGNGVGGRNMELALSFAMAIEGIDGITLLSAGTDGTDGPTDAAGAIVDGQTVLKAKHIGLNPEEYLDNNDSYSFFKKAGGLLVTGPTGTNVMDMHILVIE